MFRQKVFDGIATELFSSESRKEWIGWPSILFAQPSPQHGHGLPAKGRAAFFPSLTTAPDMGSTTRDDILAAEPHQF
jgi:hypothetical protein